MASDQVLGIAILAVVVAVLLSTVIYARRYKKVPPGKAMVVFGKPEKGGRGYRVISGGGKLIVPIVESIEWLDLKIHRLDLALTDVVADFRGVRELLALRAVAEVKIGSDETSLNAAAESL